MDASGRSLEKLESVLAEYPRVLVAFSGGVDSSVVAAAAARAKGSDALAVTLTGPSHPSRDRRMAEEVARRAGIQHLMVPIDQLADADYRKNDAERCYFCRRLETTRLREIATERGFYVIVDGVHRDDLGELRPGLRALQEQGVRHPLVEAGLGKSDVREVARLLGLPNQDAPANACLSSRIQRGVVVRVDDLRRVDEAEEFLVALGFPFVRVRTDGAVARVEVPKEDLPRLAEPRMWSRVQVHLESLGFLRLASAPASYRIGGGAP